MGPEALGLALFGWIIARVISWHAPSCAATASRKTHCSLLYCPLPGRKEHPSQVAWGSRHPACAGPFPSSSRGSLLGPHSCCFWRRFRAGLSRRTSNSRQQTCTAKPPLFTSSPDTCSVSDGSVGPEVRRLEQAQACVRVDTYKTLLGSPLIGSWRSVKLPDHRICGF